jgi:NAD(P)H dehydrogenase (quinone)
VENGRIIALSSSVLAKSFPGYGPYIASKAGVEGLIHVLANELRGHKITVNAVAPGPVGTELPPLFDPSPGFPEAKGQIDSLSVALRRSEAKRIVALSTIGAHVTRPNLLNSRHMMEESFRQLPMPVTFLRPGWFMENHAGDVSSAISEGIIHSYLQPIEHAIPMIATKDIGALAGTLLLESWSGKRVVELEAKTRVSSADIAATLTDILGKPVKAEPVPRARWEEVFRAQGMKNPTPRIQMIEGFNEGWIEFEGGFEGSVKGQTSLKTVLEEMVRDARKQAA